MALDYSKLTDDELEAIANDDYSKLSDRTLRMISREPAAKKPVSEPGSIAGMAAPAVTAVGMQPTGMGQLAQDVFAVTKPFAQSVGQGISSVGGVYRAHPIAAPLADVIGLGTVGIPPVATAQAGMGAVDKFQALQAGKNIASQALSQGAAATTAVRGLPTTTTIGPYMDMLKSAPPEVATKISEAYGMKTGGGGNNAVRSWLKSAEGAAALKANPEFAANAARYLEAVPSYGQQAMKVAGPIMRGAARVAGPVGMAANLYEAAPYLEQAGPEASSGRAMGRIQSAQRYMLDQPTPAPLSAVEAQNLLDSGDIRTINIYGGVEKLKEIVKSKRVPGPIAP